MQNATGRAGRAGRAGRSGCVPGTRTPGTHPAHGWWAGRSVGRSVGGLVGCVPLAQIEGEGGPSTRRVGHGTLHEQFFIF